MARGTILGTNVPHVTEAGSGTNLSQSYTESVSEPAVSRKRSALGKIIDQEWAPAILFLLFDVISWGIIYGAIIYARHDQSFSGPFEFVIVELIQLAVIVQALFIIGVYRPRTDRL